MAWHGADMIRFFRRMRHDHNRGVAVPYSIAVITAAIDWLECCRELERLDQAASDPEQPDRAAYPQAAAALETALPAKQRRLASALRLDGVEEWATFLPGFDASFPPEIDHEEPPNTP